MKEETKNKIKDIEKGIQPVATGAAGGIAYSLIESNRIVGSLIFLAIAIFFIVFHLIFKGE